MNKPVSHLMVIISNYVTTMVSQDLMEFFFIVNCCTSRSPFHMSCNTCLTWWMFLSLWLRTQKQVMNPENNKSYQSSNHQTRKQIYCEFSNNNIQISMPEWAQTYHKICLFLRSLCWHCKSTHNPWNMRLEPSSPGTLSWSSSKLPISCEGTSYVGLEILWGLSVMVPVGKLWRRG